MRARQRHFNAAGLGAKLVLDARFISGKNDGDAVDSWSDISGSANNASQATAAARPTYKTAIQGGQPVVRFDGGDVVSGSISASNSAMTVFCVFKQTTGVRFAGLLVGHIGGNTNDYSDGFLYTAEFDGATRDIAWGPGNAPLTYLYVDTDISSFNISSATRSGTSGVAYKNAVQVATGTVAADTDTLAGYVVGGRYLGGAVSSLYRMNGDIAYTAYLPSSLSASARLRVERGMALSFKIACS